jgi:hypothetical protein
MPRPQFTLRALLVAMFVVAAFFTGAEFGARREQQRLASERAKVEAQQENLTSWFRRIAKYYDDEAPLPFNDLKPMTENARRVWPPEPLSWPATRPATQAKE